MFISSIKAFNFNINQVSNGFVLKCTHNEHSYKYFIVQTTDEALDFIKDYIKSFDAEKD